MDVLIWDPAERYLLSTCITLLFFIVFTLLKRASNMQNKNEKYFLYYISFGVLGLSFDLLFRFLTDFLIQGSFHDYGFYGDVSNLSQEFLTLRRFVYISYGVGTLISMFFMESIIKKTKYIITVLNAITLVLLIVSPYIIVEVIYMIHTAITLYFITGAQFYFIRQSRREFKGIIYFLFIGLFSINFPRFLMTYQVKELQIIPIILPLMFILIGIFSVLGVLFLEPKKFSENLKMWYLVALFVIIFDVLFVITGIFQNIPIAIKIFGLAISIPGMTFSIFLIRYSILNFKSGISAGINQEEEYFLSFARPAKVTEEEVSVSKEKKICLVCKGTGLRFTYICPECNAIYCQKCATTLSGMENVCWVCETPFDESKPIKLPEKKVEEIVAEENEMKKV